VKEGKVRTYDMMRIPGGANAIRQGAASTTQMADAVLAQLELRSAMSEAHELAGARGR
jgi:3-isopropylmalate dehydrogenase